MFSPQSIEKVDRDRLVFAFRPGQPLPWETGHELTRRELRPNQTWQHIVYLGIYSLEELFEALAQVFEPDRDSYDERPPGESAVAAVVVDEHGHVLPDSAVLSSCAWATGQVLRGGRAGGDWLSRFKDATPDFGEAIRKLVTTMEFSDSEDDAPEWIPRLLDHSLLTECLALAVDAAGVAKALTCAEVRIKSRIVARRTTDGPASHDFLNSFIMSDLDLVADKIAKGDIGAALREYLRPEADIVVAGRVDVRDRMDTVLAATAPQAVPAGRWPSHPEHALALNQQLAVSTALGMTTAGVLGVNGPPGTGKTTMLRDLVAALVVERARRLAALTDPGKAFIGRPLRWSTGQRTRVVSVWRPDLTGFEIVVASANNGAVQNVTDEIPAADAIDGSWLAQSAAVDYFSDVATALLSREPDAETTPAMNRAWALVAARLGNKNNRSRFVDTFWYHTPDGPAEGPTKGTTKGYVWSGLLSVLKGYEQASPTAPWSEAVEQFHAAEAQVEAIRVERSKVYRDIERRAHIEGELAALHHALKSAADTVETTRLRHRAAIDTERERAAEADRIARARQAEAEDDAHRRLTAAEQSAVSHQRLAERLVTGRKATAERAARSWEAELRQRWQAHAAHQQSRPGLRDRLRTFGEAHRRWAAHDGWLMTEVRQAQGALDTAHRELNAAQREIDAVHQAMDAAWHKAASIRRSLDAGLPTPKVDHTPLTAARRAVALAEREFSVAVRAQDEAESAVRAAKAERSDLDDKLRKAASVLGQHYPDAGWHTDRKRREMVALWTDKDWNLARSELFLAALELHKAFLRHSARQMRRNLQAAMDLISGDAPADLPDNAALAAWQSLFFVVPVVSTTFASYARLFSHLGREALGWLLIDEAGQATPQNAVGALWRTRRAVVVGDPLQLEPITTLPFRAEQAIRIGLNVDEQWLTSRTSVQRLADRLTLLGTRLPGDGDSDPTWVGVPLTVHRRCDQPMFDIVNRIAYGGLMINGTGTRGRDRFRVDYPTLPQSKWIDVAGTTAQGHWIPDEGRQLDRILDTLAKLEFDPSEVLVIGPFRDVAREIGRRARLYPGMIAGTVHTAQGKQADIVVLVLGSAPDRIGARRWASSKPNLLNVAVSRAKRRLYVIGNRQAWSILPYFKVLAAELPHHNPRQP